MKNLHKVLALLLCLCLLSACGAADTPAETDRAGADADLGSFTLGRAESADGRYYAEANTDEPTVRIHIYDSADGKELFSFDSVRRLDYWGLCWETNMNNLWVQSGDVGLVCYAFRDGEWVLDPDAVRPPEIVSKYDADPTGMVLPVAGPTVDPEAVGSKGFYCIIHTPDGVERLVSGERAGELYQLFSAGRDKGEESISLSQPSDVLVLRFYQRSEDLSRLAYGAEYYAAFPDDSGIYAETTITLSYARGFALPKGSYRDVLELAAGLPTLDDALAECVRARPSGGDGTYTYDLFDFGQNRVRSVGPFSTPLSVYPLTDVYGHLIVLCGSGGPERSAQWRVYFDPASGTLSEAYDNVLLENSSVVWCGEVDSVRICAPISGELLGVITDFSESLAPTADSPFLSAEISASGLLVVRYLAGEDYHEVSDRYAMTSMSSQKLGYRLVTGDTSPEKDVVLQLGDSLGDLRRTLDWRLNTGSVGHLAWWENSSDYTVVISRNGNTISGYARFSKDGKLLEEAGLQTIPDFDPEEWEGKPFDEFAAQFGACHADLGSGLFIPIYLSDTGKCYTLTVYADTIQLIGGTDVFSSYTLPVSALTETSEPGKTGPVPTPAPASAETEETAGVNWEEYLIAATLPPRVEPTSDIEPKHGDSLYSLRQQLDGHLIAESFFHLAWENKTDYAVAVAKNGSTVSGYARFSKDGELLEENGLRTIPDFDPDEWVGRPFDEFTAQFGACHVDIGSGLSIPTYISGTGKIYYLTVDSNMILWIGVLDLTAPEQEKTFIYVPESGWETCTVRVINYSIGTEFFVLHADGTYCIYGTTAICSLSAFNNGTCPVEVIRSGELAAEELEFLKEDVPIIYKDGEMLPITEPKTGSAFCEVEVCISVDGSEEASFYKNYDKWAGYPQLSYDMLLQLVIRLDPQSAFLPG